MSFCKLPDDRPGPSGAEGVTAFPARRFQQFALGLHENRPLNHAVGARTRCMEAVT